MEVEQLKRIADAIEEILRIIKTDMFTHKIPTKILRVMTERDREKLKNKKSCKPQAPSSKQR